MMYCRERKFSNVEKWRMLRFLGFHRKTAELLHPTKRQLYRDFWTHDTYGGHFSTSEAVKLVKGMEAKEAQVRYSVPFHKPIIKK